MSRSPRDLDRPPWPNLSGSAILVVAADSAVSSQAREVLVPLGGRVEDAASGEEALQRVRGTEYRAIISEARLPDMRIDELIDRLRDALEQVPIIVVLRFGWDESPAQARIRRTGARMFLYTPFRPHQLAAMVANVTPIPGRARTRPRPRDPLA